MPKGVEHTNRPYEDCSRYEVILALMPKGVEHSEFEHEVGDLVAPVILALMPKGVEHVKNEVPPC